MPENAIPIEFYEEYWDELGLFPESVTARLHTFLELAGFDPYDLGLLAVCERMMLPLRGGRLLAYPLADGYWALWKVKKSKSRLVTLSSARQVIVQVLGIERIDFSG